MWKKKSWCRHRQLQQNPWLRLPVPFHREFFFRSLQLPKLSSKLHWDFQLLETELQIRPRTHKISFDACPPVDEITWRDVTSEKGLLWVLCYDLHQNIFCKLSKLIKRFCFRILRVQCEKLRLDEDFSFESLARLTPGFVGADLMSLTREAALIAVNRWNGNFCLKVEVQPNSNIFLSLYLFSTFNKIHFASFT